jgi:hypothetical protein
VRRGRAGGEGREAVEQLRAPRGLVADERGQGEGRGAPVLADQRPLHDLAQQRLRGRPRRLLAAPARGGQHQVLDHRLAVERLAALRGGGRGALRLALEELVQELARRVVDEARQDRRQLAAPHVLGARQVRDERGGRAAVPAQGTQQRRLDAVAEQVLGAPLGELAFPGLEEVAQGRQS